MSECTIEKVEYSGSDFAGDVQSATGLSEPLRHVRLEMTVDDWSAREPFLVRANLDGPGFGNAQWMLPIDRAWYYEDQIDIAVWVTPALSRPDSIYTDVDTKIGSQTVGQTGGESGVLSFLGGSLTVPYDCGPGPDPQYIEANGSDNSSETQLYRTAGIESAMADFESVTDDGLSYIEKEDMVAVADTLSSRVDDDDDGYPDGPIELVDQSGLGLCVASTLLVHFGCFWPRRLIEFLRSFYQPIAFDEDGNRECGFLSRSESIMFPSEVRDLYQSRLARGEDAMTQTPDSAHVAAHSIQLLVQYLIRASLLQLPPIQDLGISIRNRDDQYRRSGIGMDDYEAAAVASEVLGLDNMIIADRRQNAQFNDGVDIAIEVAQATTSGKLGILMLDGVLIEGLPDPDNASLPVAVNDHAITVLGLESSGSDEYLLTFQNSWEAKADVRTLQGDNFRNFAFSFVTGEGP